MIRELAQAQLAVNPDASDAFAKATETYLRIQREQNKFEALQHVMPGPPPPPPPPPQQVVHSLMPPAAPATALPKAKAPAASQPSSAAPGVAPLPQPPPATVPVEMLEQLIGHSMKRGGNARPPGDGFGGAAAEMSSCGGSYAEMSRSDPGMADVLPPPPEPAAKTSELHLLRRNVKALYEDARTHILVERNAATLVRELNSKVETLQKAFRQLAEVAIEELEGLRADVERSAAQVDELRRSEPRVRALEQQMTRVATWQEEQNDLAVELARLQHAEAERERREARYEAELQQLREQAEYDRASLQKAVRALNAATAAVEERQVQSDAAIRANREGISALSAKQEVLDDEVGILADAMHEATLGAAASCCLGRLTPRLMQRLKPSLARVQERVVGGGGGGGGFGGDGFGRGSRHTGSGGGGGGRGGGMGVGVGGGMDRSEEEPGFAGGLYGGGSANGLAESAAASAAMAASEASAAAVERMRQAPADAPTAGLAASLAGILERPAHGKAARAPPAVSPD